MDCWEILEIRKTDDEEAVRKAYLKKLPGFHPEENPEGFRILRQAMEEALRLAAGQRQAGEGGRQTGTMSDSREIRALVRETQELYRDYGRRIQPEKWKELVSCPVCEDLETQKEAGWAILGFLMDHIHLSHDCYAVLDQTFGWMETQEELSLHFPGGFVDYLADRVEREDSFRYDKTPLREDFDYDRFFELFFELRTALGEKDRDRVEKTLGELEAMGMEHPDLTILKIRHLSMVRGMENRAWEMARELYEKDRDNAPTRYWYVRTAMDMGETEAASDELEEVITGLVEEDKENPGYWQMLGTYLEKQGRLDQALKALRRARDLGPGEWDYVEDQIARVADLLSRQLEEQDFEDKWALVNICWMGRRYDRVRELLDQTQRTEDNQWDWLFMMATSCREMEDHEAALKYRTELWELCGKTGTDRPLALYMELGEDYRLTGNDEKALEIYGEAAKVFGESPELCYRQASLLAEEKKNREAVAMCEKALAGGFHREATNLRLELLLNLEEYERVQEDARELIDQGYGTAQVLYDYAQALRQLEDYGKAEEVLKELYDRTQGADMVCEEYAFLCYDADRSEEALKWIEEALEGRDTMRRQYLKGSCLHDLSLYEKEKEVYRHVMEQGGDDYYASYRMGKAFEGAGEFQEAEKWFDRALNQYADFGMAWDALGDVRQKQGKWQEALKAYEEGKRQGHLQSARDLCRLLKRLHEDDRAEECIRESLEQWPDDRSLLLLRSDILLRKKRYEEVVKCLNRYIEVYPAQTDRGYREIAECYERQGDLEKAREYYQKAIDTAPGSARCWRLMGKFLANKVKDQKGALPYLEKSVELAPDSTYGFMKLGEVYEALGDQDKALECYERSLENYRADIESDPDDCCNYEGIADVLVHLGRLEEAEKAAHKAISLECRVFTCSGPCCYESYEDLAKAEEKRGNLEKALEWMEQAGRDSTTDYYPKEIARLKAAVAEQKSYK
ncbi:MAG: tetratricopeptide repeat protein [Hungatella sp.]|nr:tetratricopeptide repeat protein [Hungatella sp.]